MEHVQATKEIANLAASMPRLQAFIYVSTCYVNAHRPQGSHVEEAIFPLVRATSGTTVQHAELAAKLAKMPPAKAEKAVSPHMRLERVQTLYRYQSFLLPLPGGGSQIVKARFRLQAVLPAQWKSNYPKPSIMAQGLLSRP